MRKSFFKNIGYNLQNVRASLLNNKIISLGVILSVIIGGIFSIALISVGFNYYEETEVMSDKVENIYLLTIDERYDNLMKMIDKYDSIQYISGDVGERKGTFVNGKFSLTRVLKIQINYRGMFKDFISKGRYFNEEEYDKKLKVCIMGKNFYHEDGIGSNIRIGDESYRVIGYSRIKDFADFVFTPLCMDELEGAREKLLYQVKFKDGSSKVQMEEILGEILQASNNEGQFLSGEQYFKNHSKNMRILFIVLSIIGIVVFTYSMINICTVLINKVDHDKKSIGIKLALGAGRKDIYMEVFMQLTILMTIGLAVSVAVIYSASLFSENIKISISTAIYIMILGVIWNMILSLILVKKSIKSRSARAVIEG